jgi:hypothetical protein
LITRNFREMGVFGLIFRSLSWYLDFFAIDH